MCNNNLACKYNITDNNCAKMCFLIEIIFILKAIKSHLKVHMINIIMLSWSFLMKLTKLANTAVYQIPFQSCVYIEDFQEWSFHIKIMKLEKENTS